MQQQTKVLSVSQVKNNFGTIVSQVRSGIYKEVIVENHGQPIVAIIPMKEFESMNELTEKEKRKRALTMLRNAREQVQARIKGKMTEEEADEIANRFSRELIKDLEKEGKIRFERRSS